MEIKTVDDKNKMYSSIVCEKKTFQKPPSFPSHLNLKVKSTLLYSQTNNLFNKLHYLKLNIFKNLKVLLRFFSHENCIFEKFLNKYEN